MRLTTIELATTQGREVLQDTVATAASPDGSQYMGVFDGHGNNGHVFARAASEQIAGLSQIGYIGRAGMYERAQDVKAALLAVHQRYSGSYIGGGTTATVGIFSHDQLGVVYVGDSEAYYYQDDGRTMQLLHPHNADNPAERERVRSLGFAVVRSNRTIYFRDPAAGNLAVSRAIGDYNYRFATPEAEIVLTPRLRQPGTLVIGTDGLWGHNHDTVERAVRNYRTAGIAQRLTAMNAELNRDDASAVIARIE